MNLPVKQEKQYYRGLNRNKWRFFSSQHIYKFEEEDSECFPLMVKAGGCWDHFVEMDRKYDKTHLLGRQTSAKR